ncbi:hypothetical protein [Paraburkholderia sp. BCC1886]|uniref:hypothetical protein n=1 Tax=Paraburkholderia sp. BCC1886 TaxID=2562670 RepID=UPI001181DD05|nr:hypothetical protein [Paraburkholderia sp. BCC1886]
MRSQDEIKSDINRTATVKRTYEKQMDELKKVVDEDAAEVARLITATTRGINRTERKLKTLGKELAHRLDADAGDEQS